MPDWLDLVQYMNMPVDASAHGHEIDLMMNLVHWLMIFLFVVWAPYFLYTLYRFRASKNPEASYEGSESEWSTYLEVGVVVAEGILLVGFAFPVWADLTEEENQPLPDEALEVRVVAEQFNWNIHYPGPDGVFGRTSPEMVDDQTNPLGLDSEDPASKDDIVQRNEFHIPVDKPVIVHLSSKDVIHGFFLPQMRIKQDAIPGMEIPVWFEATETGEFEIACAQLCGNGHYRMNGFVTVHSQEDFETWRQKQVSSDG